MRKATLLVLLLCSLMGRSQSNVTTLTQKFNAYQTLLPKTQLHLLFNQEKFAPGDTAWFKAYFLKEDLSGVAGKQLIEVNLVDSHGEAKVHFLFTLTNGLGYNQLIIPETLPAGIYLITAHSSWMKNFNPDLIFKKKIEIVINNTLAEETQVQAGVEGGHLIAGLKSRVSIYTNRIGSTIQVVDSAGQEVGRSTTSQGVASIVFTPQRNPYFARIVGESKLTPLPPLQKDGCSLHLTPAHKGEPVKILVNAPANSTLRNKELILLVTARGKLQHTATITLEQEFHIPSGNLPEGIAHVAVLDPEGNLVASRDYYNSGNDFVQPKIQIDKQYYQPREKVRVEVSLTNSKGEPIEGEFAMSVINAGLFDEKQTSLSDELNLAGLQNQLLIDRTDSTWLTTLDNLLILFPEDVPWPEINSNVIRKPRYPFTSVIERKGQAYFPGTLTPVPDYTQIMFYLQKNLILHQTFAMDSGRVGLVLPDIYSPDEFFYIAQIRNGKEIQNLKIVWEEEPRVQMYSPVSRETEVVDPYASFVTRTRLIKKSFSDYSTDDASVSRSEAGESDFEEEIMGANITVQVQDYALFPTMAELVKEVIPSMYHRKTKKKEIVRVGLLPPMVETNDPIYIIDGIATSNTNFFLSLKPADLLTIKIFSDPRKLAPLGLMGQNGLVIVHTKAGNAREPLDDQAKMITGLNRPLTFNNRDYSAASDTHRPDFRSTIYWNPVVKTNKNGKVTVEFYTSDDLASLRIRIDGLAGGKPFTAGQEIVVSVPEKK